MDLFQNRWYTSASVGHAEATHNDRAAPFLLDNECSVKPLFPIIAFLGDSAIIRDEICTDHMCRYGPKVRNDVDLMKKVCDSQPVNFGD